MPTPTYDALASTTLGSTSSIVLFSNIPQNYTDLVIVANLKMDLAVATEDLDIVFNSNTTASYSYTRMYGTAAAASGSVRGTSGTAMRIARCTGTSATSALYSQNILQINSYTNTLAYKTIFSRATDSDTDNTYIGLWQSTSPITSFYFSRSSGNFAAGSSVSVYGIRRA